jgi:hypothetical protein
VSAQLLQRCTASVEQCRKDLADLRAACKAASAHREKCAELLGAATEAVVALEDMLYDPDIDMRLERMLQQLSLLFSQPVYIRREFTANLPSSATPCCPAARRLWSSTRPSCVA